VRGCENGNKADYSETIQLRLVLKIDLFDRRKRMSLINLLIVLVLVGVLLWAINTYIPMDRKIKNILNIVVVVIVVLWLLQVFGVLGSLDSIRIGR
jgi:hypothetical protein